MPQYEDQLQKLNQKFNLSINLGASKFKPPEVKKPRLHTIEEMTDFTDKDPLTGRPYSRGDIRYPSRADTRQEVPNYSLHKFGDSKGSVRRTLLLIEEIENR